MPCTFVGGPKASKSSSPGVNYIRRSLALFPLAREYKYSTLEAASVARCRRGADATVFAIASGHAPIRLRKSTPRPNRRRIALQRISRCPTSLVGLGCDIVDAALVVGLVFVGGRLRQWAANRASFDIELGGRYCRRRLGESDRICCLWVLVWSAQPLISPLTPRLLVRNVRRSEAKQPASSVLLSFSRS